MKKVNPIHVQKFLKGIRYPTGKQELVEHARRREADAGVIETLERIPMDHFNSPNDVAAGIGKIEAA